MAYTVVPKQAVQKPISQVHSLCAVPRSVPRSIWEGTGAPDRVLMADGAFGGYDARWGEMFGARTSEATVAAQLECG